MVRSSCNPIQIDVVLSKTWFVLGYIIVDPLKNEPFQVVTSKRGRPVIVHAGYRHYMKAMNKNFTIRWVCIYRSCPGSIITNDDMSKLVSLKPHACVPSFF